MYYSIYNPYSSELYHHGILGQKWGIRRYQYEDGTLTPEGKKRYYKNGYSSEGGYTRAGKNWLKKEAKRKKEEAEYNKRVKTFGKGAADFITLSKKGLKITGAILGGYLAAKTIVGIGGFGAGVAFRQHGKKIVDEVMKQSAKLKNVPGGTQAWDNFRVFGAAANAEAVAGGANPNLAKQLEYFAYGVNDVRDRAYNAVNNAKYNARYAAYRAKDWARGQAAPVRDAINKAKNKRKPYNKAGFYPPAVIR